MEKIPGLTIRRMLESDMDVVSGIQRQAYGGHYLEPESVLRQRLHAAPETAWVALLGAEVKAYLFGYRSLTGRVTPLSAVFAPVPNGDCLYIHDLAVASSARGRRLGPALATHAFAYAERTGYHRCALVSVQGSRSFWQRYGFAACAPDGHGRLSESYGSDAVYMVRQS